MTTNPTTIHNSLTIQPTVMLLLPDLLVVPLSGAQETTVTYTLLCGTLNTLINECQQPKFIFYKCYDFYGHLSRAVRCPLPPVVPQASGLP